MATTSLITGRVPLPSDDPISYAELTFTLSGLDSEGSDVFLPGISKRVVLVDSEIPAGFDLWRNTEGYRGTNYKLMARWVEVTRDGKRDRYAELPAIQIGDEASYSFADLLMHTPYPTPETSYWMSITQEEYDAALAAADATAADRLQTGLDAAAAAAAAVSAATSASNAAATLANAALKSANLSDMASKPTALTNLRGYTAIATVAGTTTLTAASTLGQRFIGVTTQTIVLPVTTTLALGWEFTIENASTGALTVNSSGGNLVGSIPAGMTAKVKCILASGTTAASWVLYVQRIASQKLITTSTTSGTVKTVTGIPIWANEVVIHLNGIGLTAVENINLRIGTASGGISTTGYFSVSPVFNSTSFVTGASTTSFVLAHSGTGRNAAGVAILRRGANNRWSVDANYYLGSGICAIANGTGLLLGPLDRIELSCASGFNAGDFSVEWRA